MKPAYLIAYGPNNVEIICMIFESFSKGMKWVIKNSPENWVWQFHQEPDSYRFASPAIPEKYLDESIPEHKEFFDKIFTSWYFGCGEADTVCLIELDEYAKALVPFDLD